MNADFSAVTSVVLLCHKRVTYFKEDTAQSFGPHISNFPKFSQQISKVLVQNTDEA